MGCLRCNRTSCLVCGAPWHGGLTCQEGQTLRASATPAKAADDEAKTRAYLAKSNIRICPKCKNGVLKASGCDKMMCRCGCKFCISCGQAGALTCSCTPSAHGFVNNKTGRADFRRASGGNGNAGRFPPPPG